MSREHEAEYPLSTLMANNARAGTGPGVHGLIRAFCETVDSGYVPDPPILGFLSEALGRVMGGEKADVVFAVVRNRPGRRKKKKSRDPRDPKVMRDRKLAAAVAKEIEKRPHLTTAYHKVARDNSVSSATVRRAWKTWEFQLKLSRAIWPRLQEDLHRILRRQALEGESEDALRQSMVDGLLEKGNQLKALGDLVRSWGAWRSGVVTDECYKRNREVALHVCAEFGMRYAEEHKGAHPSKAWSEARKQPELSFMISICVTPPPGHEIRLAGEAELEQVWKRGFRRARGPRPAASPGREGSG